MSLSVKYSAIYRSAGLFDISAEYGRLFARGRDAIDLLHRMSTNDLKPLEEQKGVAVLTALTNEKGRLVDVLKVIRDTKGDVLIIASHDKEQAIIQWLDKFTIMEDARFEPATEKIAQFFICGPSARSIIQNYSQSDLGSATNADVYDITVDGINATLLKGPSLACSGWLILTLRDSADRIWSRLQADLISIGGVEGNCELYELLRIENGTPIAPNELNEKHNPLETGLAKEAVSFTKGCYIGQEVIARLDAQDKVQRKLMGMVFSGDGVVPGDRLVIEGLDTPLGNEVGEVTSVARSPKHGFIGLGYVRGKYAIAATNAQVDGHKDISVRLVDLPLQ